jgi:citrate lyase beta subunit
MLFMPGDSLRKINKASQLEADCLVLDLEDGVALNRKAEARQITSQALLNLDFGRKERLVRLNPPQSELGQADLTATIAARPDGYVIPKVETAAVLEMVELQLAQAEVRYGWPAGSIRLFAVVETAKGIMNLKEIAQASPRLAALMFGAEDLAGDMGAMRSRDNWEVFYARSALVTAAAAYGRQAIDIVLVDFNDDERLIAEATFARHLGYAGKMAIHPRQIPLINQVFSPSPAEIAQAQRLIAAHQAQQLAGSGVFEIEGKMVDRPLVRAAERLLAKARLAGLLAEGE